MAVGAINIALGATVGGFVSAFGTARQAVGQLSTDINTRLVTAFNNADRSNRFFERGIGRLGTGLQDVGGRLTTFLTLPLLGAGAGALKMAADMEQASVSFRVLLKDATLATQTLESLKGFAASTPFGFSEVQSGAKQLLAYGYTVEQLIPLLTDAGNLASGMGEQIGEVTRVFGRIRAGDFGEAFERLRDFGVGRDVLEGKGLVFDKSGSYKGSVAQAMTAIRQVIQERFGGQMEEQSKTLGGIWANFQDQASFALTEVGQRIVTAFNLKEVGADVVAFIGTIRDSFNGLSPEIQNIAVVVGTAAAALGPLLVGLGSIMKLLPVLTGGFAALGGPIGIAVAAIVTASALIIANWDKVKVYWEQFKTALVDTGVWTTIQGVASAAIDAVMAVFQFGVRFITKAWNDLKGFLIPTARFIFGALGAIFNTGMGVLTGILKVITGVFTADWSKLREGMQNITASLWNGIISLTSSSIVFVGSLFAAFVEKVGATDFAASIRSGMDGITSSANRMRIALQNAKKELPAANTLPEVTVVGRRQAGDMAITGGGGAAAEEKRLLSPIEKLNKQLSETEDRIQSLRLVAPFSFALRQAEYLRAELLDLKKIADPDFRLPKRDIPGDRTEEINARLPFTAALDPNKVIQPLNARAATAQIAEFNNSMVNALAQLRDSINSSLSSAASAAADGMGNLIGGLLAGTETLASLPALFGGILGGLAQQIGKAMIAFGLSGEAIQKLAKAPGAAVVAGVALVALGALLKNSVANSVKSLPRFANGNVAFGETIGVFGEYPGASINPEITTPKNIMADVVRREIARAGGAGGFADGQVITRVSGEDIDLVWSRYQKTKYEGQ